MKNLMMGEISTNSGDHNVEETPDTVQTDNFPAVENEVPVNEPSNDHDVDTIDTQSFDKGRYNVSCSSPCELVYNSQDGLHDDQSTHFNDLGDSHFEDGYEDYQYYSQSDDGQFTLVENLKNLSTTIAFGFSQVAIAVKEPETEHGPVYEIGLNKEELKSGSPITLQNQDSTLQLHMRNGLIYLPNFLESRQERSVAETFGYSSDEGIFLDDVILLANSENINLDPEFTFPSGMKRVMNCAKLLLSKKKKEQLDDVIVKLGEKMKEDMSKSPFEFADYVPDFCQIVTLSPESIILKVDKSAIINDISSISFLHKLIPQSFINHIIDKMTKERETVSLPIAGLLVRGEVLNKIQRIKRESAKPAKSKIESEEGQYKEFAQPITIASSAPTSPTSSRRLSFTDDGLGDSPETSTFEDSVCSSAEVGDGDNELKPAIPAWLMDQPGFMSASSSKSSLTEDGSPYSCWRSENDLGSSVDTITSAPEGAKQRTPSKRNVVYRGANRVRKRFIEALGGIPLGVPSSDHLNESTSDRNPSEASGLEVVDQNKPSKKNALFRGIHKVKKRVAAKLTPEGQKLSSHLIQATTTSPLSNNLGTQLLSKKSGSATKKNCHGSF